MPSTFALAQLSSYSKQNPSLNDIIFSLKLSKDQSKLLVSTSSGELRLLSAHTLQATARVPVTKARLVDFHFTSPSTACTVSSDGRLAWWDFRARNRAIVNIQTNMPLTTGDVEPFGSGLVVTGAEKHNHSSPICFWDVRQPSAPVVSWGDQHYEEITQVRFHPRESGRLISASVDGLLCQSQFNAILTPVEEDSLQSVIQTACPIDAFAFTPTARNPELLAIWSPMQTALFADLQSGDLLGNLGDVRRFSGGEASQIIAFDASPETDCPIYFSALPDGRVQVFLIRSMVGEGGVELVSELAGGHCEAVRSVLYLPGHGVLFTGGEDAKVIGWSINQ